MCSHLWAAVVENRSDICPPTSPLSKAVKFVISKWHVHSPSYAWLCLRKSGHFLWGGHMMYLVSSTLDSLFFLLSSLSNHNSASWSWTGSTELSDTLTHRPKICCSWTYTPTLWHSWTEHNWSSLLTKFHPICALPNRSTSPCLAALGLHLPLKCPCVNVYVPSPLRGWMLGLLVSPVIVGDWGNIVGNGALSTFEHLC